MIGTDGQAGLIESVIHQGASLGCDARAVQGTGLVFDHKAVIIPGGIQIPLDITRVMWFVHVINFGFIEPFKSEWG